MSTLPFPNTAGQSGLGYRSTVALQHLYDQMVLIRVLEQRLLALFGEGKLSGTTHTSIGQEDVAVGIVGALDSGRDSVFSNHRCHGHFIAYGGPLDGLVAEIMGKPSGVCGGRGGSQHLCWKQFYSNGIQGGIVPPACGIALAKKIREPGSVVCVFLGDGTLGEGAVYESFNLAALWQLPVLFVIEDNGYAQTTPKSLGISGSLTARPESFGIPTYFLAGGDVCAIRDVTTNVLSAIRSGHGPACLVVETYRLAAHSKGDDTRDPAELKAAWERDPVLKAASLLPPPMADKSRLTAEMAVEAAVQRAQSEVEVINAISNRALGPARGHSLTLPAIKRGERVVERLNAGWRTAMEEDTSIFLLGEDILDPYGGAFKVTRGLSTLFPSRVKTTPISEAAITGLAAGAALSGLRPVVEIMFGDFCTLIADQVVNHASKFRWIYNDQVRVPMVIRTPMGGRRGYGPTHSQTLDRLFLGVPGLRVVAISSFYDPAETVACAISQDDPVFLIENKLAYSALLQTPPLGFTIDGPSRPLGPLHLRPIDRKPEVTILAYGGMDLIAVKAAELLADEEIVAEVILPQQIAPSDGWIEEVVTAAKTSSRLVVAEEGTGPWGFGAEVLAAVFERSDTRHVQATRVATPCIPLASSREQEKHVLPDETTILRAVVDLYLSEPPEVIHPRGRN